MEKKSTRPFVKKRVSVVLPVHFVNCKWLTQAISSVLDQDYPKLELIVVNDAATENIDDLVKSLGITKYIKNSKNMGWAYSANRGFEIANGEYFYKIDADDYIFPGMISRLVEELEQHEDFSVVFARHQIIDENGNLLIVKSDEQLHVANVSGCDINNPVVERKYCFYGGETGCWLMRRQVWETLGGYDETIPGGVDFEFWMRTSRKFKMRRLPFAEKPYHAYRQHSHSMTSTGSGFSKVKLGILKRETALYPDDRDLAKAFKYWNKAIKIEKRKKLFQSLRRPKEFFCFYLNKQKKGSS